MLWKPRDTVGGDFYAFRQEGGKALLGLFDCAGHGVPGAMMTMLMSSALDGAIAARGIERPAALLARTDAVGRVKLAESSLSSAVAAETDAALVFIDRNAGLLRFSGAKISLFVSDGREVREFRGARRPLCGKRTGEFADIDIAIRHEHTYYLVSDGFLDQAGGEHGFGFGKSRFAAMLLRHAGLAPAASSIAFANALAEYQGGRPQRDDITLIGFRFPQTPLPNQETA